MYGGSMKRTIATPRENVSAHSLKHQPPQPRNAMLRGTALPREVHCLVPWDLPIRPSTLFVGGLLTRASRRKEAYKPRI